MDFGVIIGLLAACLTTGALIPQAVKTWRSRSAGDLSLGMFLMMSIGTCCWLIYGLLQQDLPLILANAFAMSISSVILYVKVSSMKGQRARA